MFSVCFLSYKEYKLSVLFITVLNAIYVFKNAAVVVYQYFFPCNPLFYTLFNIAVGLIEGIQAD